MNRIAIRAMLCAVMLVAAERAHAADAYHLQQNAAYAVFSASDGCLESTSFIAVADTTVSGEPLAVFSYQQLDTCTDEVIAAYEGRTFPLPAFDFSLIVPTLAGATLHTTVRACNASDECFDVAADLAWTASDPAITSGSTTAPQKSSAVPSERRTSRWQPS